MISTFLGAATIQNGTISIEPNSRNLIIFTDTASNNSISVRGPYTVDAAIENESNVIRMPSDAMLTLDLKLNDTIIIGNDAYMLNETRNFEQDILRLPIEAKNVLHIEDGDIIQNSRLLDVFSGSVVYHTFEKNNTSFVENFLLSSKPDHEWIYDVVVDNVTIATSFGAFKENQTYSILYDGSYLGGFTYNNSTIENLNLTNGDHSIQIKFKNTNATTTKVLGSEFVNFRYISNI